MKPLERIFFTACIHTQIKKSLSLYGVFTIFEKLGFSGKQLASYLKKWKSKGFYSYYVNMYCGDFEFDKLNGEYKVIYDKELHNNNCRQFSPFFEFTKEMMIAEIWQGYMSNELIQECLGIEDINARTVVRVPSDEKFR
jgi:hypothetical protein